MVLGKGAVGPPKKVGPTIAAKEVDAAKLTKAFADKEPTKPNPLPVTVARRHRMEWMTGAAGPALNTVYETMQLANGLIHTYTNTGRTSSPDATTKWNHAHPSYCVPSKTKEIKRKGPDCCYG